MSQSAQDPLQSLDFIDSVLALSLIVLVLLLPVFSSLVFVRLKSVSGL